MELGDTGLQLRLSPWLVPYLVATMIVFAIAVLVTFRGRGPERPGFLLMLGSVGLTLLGTGSVFAAADRETATSLVRLSQALALWTPPCAIEFAHALVGGASRRLRFFAWSSAGFVSALTLTTPWVIAGGRPYPYGFAGTAGPLYGVALFQLSITIAVPYLLWQRLKQETRLLERRQLWLVTFSAMIASLALIDTLPVIGIDAPPVGWLPLVVGAVGILSAIIRHRLLDVRLALRRSLSWFVVSLVGATPFVLVALALRRRLTSGELLPMAMLLAGLVVAMRIYLVLLQPRIDRLGGRRRRDRDAEMAIFGNQAATLQTIEELGRAVDRFLAGLDRRLAALVVIERGAAPRIAFSAWGSVPAPPATSPLLSQLSELDDLVAADAARSEERVEMWRACVRWGAEYLAPLIEGSELIGLIAIGPKIGGARADTLELDTLDRMRVTLTAAVAGVRLYDRVRSLSEELEQKAALRSSALADALEDLRRAETRLVQEVKLASLGNIVAGVAADLRDQVQAIHEQVAPLRDCVDIIVGAVREAGARQPSLVDPRVEEITQDIAPLLDSVTEGARRAHAIAQDLSGFASPRAGEPLVARQPAHLAALVDSTLTLVTGHLKEVAIVRAYDGDLPPVAVEAGPMGQEVLNLILNAVQAMRGAGTLTLATRTAGGFAELSVADTGAGIAPEILPRIFEPFFSTKGPTTGTGLGLSVSYAIVERHGGRILVESEPSRGTTFRVQIPLPR